MREEAGALLVTADPYFDTRRDRIISFAARHRLPAIYQFRDYAFAGGVLGTRNESWLPGMANIGAG